MTEKTGDLMARLISTDTPEQLGKYLDENKDKHYKDFSAFIKEHLNRRNMTPADLSRVSGIDRIYTSQIVSGQKNPSKDYVIKIAIGLEMTLEECQRALRVAKVSDLYAKDRRDAIIIYGFAKRLNIRDLNELLEKKGCKMIE